jgi:hypothetical protein
MYWLQDFGADEAVVSHVSFAGTIVSTVLALVAIGYAYFQTFSQRKDAEALAAQIAGLRGVLGELRTSSREIDSTTETLGALRDQVEQMVQAQAESITVVRSVESTVRSALDAVATSKPHAAVGSDLSRQIVDTLLKNTNEPFLAILFALAETARHNGNSDTFMKVIKVATELSGDDRETNILVHQGIAAGVAGCVIKLGLGDIEDDDPIRIDTYLANSVVKSVAARSPKSEPEKGSLGVPYMQDALGKIWPEKK